MGRSRREFAAGAAKLCGRLTADGPHLVVELANARESRGQRNLGDGQIGLLNKISSKMNTVRDRDFNRG